MEIRLTIGEKPCRADLSRPIDLSIPLRQGLGQVNCFYAPPAVFSPVRQGSFVGATQEGGPVNFFQVEFNPHGNGTHTECVGHISIEPFTIREALTKFHFVARLVSIFPRKTVNGDRVIFHDQLEEVLSPGEAEALIIRTLPNDTLKKQVQYSGSNPPYLDSAAAAYLVHCGIQHLLIDLPSVDREEDGGALSAHRSFWAYPQATRKDSTITELIYVDNSVKDGLYLLNIQTASFDLDASPSKPVLFDLEFD